MGLPNDPFQRVAVTGASGQVGYRLLEDLKQRRPGTELLSLDRETFDLNDPASLGSRLEDLSPTLVFHSAAYTQVDRAEKEKELCTTVNRDATAAIAEWCKSSEVPLVFYSTDYVFSGDSDFPYRPEAPRKPINWYGRTKAEAEELVENSGAQCLIIRTQWVYDRRGHNFLRTMLKLMAERPELRVVNDQIGAPTSAADLARASIDLAEFWLDWANPGIQIRHITNSGYTTWYDFACAIREGALRRKILTSAAQVLPIPSADYPTAAVRPLRSALDLNETLREGVTIRSWEEALDSCLDELKKEIRE